MELRHAARGKKIEAEVEAVAKICAGEAECVPRRSLILQQRPNDRLHALHTEIASTNSVDTSPTLTTDPSQAYATTVASTYTQLKELMRKRLIISLRDLKGSFFQILFPALQIMLVLVILTININPAGKSIVLLASTIDREAQVLFSGNARYLAGGHLGPQKMSLVKTRATDSEELSK